MRFYQAKKFQEGAPRGGRSFVALRLRGSARNAQLHRTCTLRRPGAARPAACTAAESGRRPREFMTQKVTLERLFAALKVVLGRLHCVILRL